MKFEKLSTGELLNYAVIMENIITSNIGIQREMSEGVAGGFCTKEEIDSIFNKSMDAKEEADAVYEKIQKELDLRSKLDLGLKFGIRRSQSIIKELEAFANNKGLEHKAREEKEAEAIKRISEESVSSMEVVSDDNAE